MPAECSEFAQMAEETFQAQESLSRNGSRNFVTFISLIVLDSS